MNSIMSEPRDVEKSKELEINQYVGIFLPDFLAGVRERKKTERKLYIYICSLM